MPKFDLKKVDAVIGVQEFYQLTIDDNPVFFGSETPEEINNLKKGVLDIYEAELEKKYKKNLVQIYSSMNRVANNQHVPGEKYHELTDRPKNDPYKDYEFKHGDLRVYAVKSPQGKIIILCGYKNQQKKDIVKMRSLKLQYFESLNQKK